MNVIELSLATIEAVNVTIATDQDVSADAVTMSLVRPGVEPSSFVAASWHPTQAKTAVSPTMGAAGAVIPVTQPGTYWLFTKVTDSPEVPVLLSATIKFF